MPKIVIVPVEPIETRYTGQWYEKLPGQIKQALPGVDVATIDGEELTAETDAGAFLNFASTSNYKASQIESIARGFASGLYENGDVFLVTDAWNPCAHMIRYMASIYGIDIKMAGFWHAGYYDPADIIARNFRKHEQDDWAYKVEQSLQALYDRNFFTTKYHKDLFESMHGESDRNVFSGYPMEYLKSYPEFYLLRKDGVKGFDFSKKMNVAIFPHRLTEEKNYEFFKSVQRFLKERGYNLLFPQEQKLRKDEYHDMLLQSKVVVSLNEQETLGIGTFEAMAAGCIPLVPDDLSYHEMYFEEYKWGRHGDAELAAIAIANTIDDYDDLIEDPRFMINLHYLKDKYLSGTQMYQHLAELIGGRR